MATQIKITKKHDPGLFDSATGNDCITEKVVNITDDCSGFKKNERVHLLFTRAERGRIVVICQGYPNEFDSMRTHFFVDELEKEFHVREIDDTFGSNADDLGITKKKLRILIEAQVPST